MDESSSGEGQVTGFCKHCNGSLGSIKCRKFLDKLLEKGSAFRN